MAPDPRVREATTADRPGVRALLREDAAWLAVDPGFLARAVERLPGDYARASVGRVLLERIIVVARDIGYRTLVLYTLPVMDSAQRVYESFGFRDIPPYYRAPVPATRSMALALSV